ncbi:LacI family transcriptional regulator [Paenibacillus sambharensis]|uniref:LacI family transcriptional regulator n=1 Tax=Paenibacillus sambharensis TaxID=1803190 RepID=A0A2W1LJB5_9BACL|nr:LacI family DNA-binding transcriptional regulator [Paenibacillus sambharensis]PZD94634.1 LacI family transcriptional regulator [Paenibacillus sambharensis]
MSKKVTMQQIADYLGVSKFVVSKALSGKGGVSAATKERVIQTASQLGYFAQKNAYVKNINLGQPLPISTAGSRQSVLVLMPNIRFQTKDSVYWGRILDGISAKTEAEGLGMVIVSEQNVDNFLHILNPNGILGMVGVGQISSSLLLEAHRVGVTMVLVDHEDPLIPTDTVFVNNYDCMYRLTKHLLATGHQEIRFVGDVRYSRSFLDRFAGFRSALEEQGIPLRDDNLTRLGEEGEGEEVIRQWAARKKRAHTLPTAIVCANDSIARDMIRVLSELGVSVPGEVSVTGFDNIEDAYRISPALSTVHVPKEALGERAVIRLLERVRHPGEPLEKILLAGEVIYRDSTADNRMRS